MPCGAVHPIISGHAEGSGRESALPPKADIVCASARHGARGCNGWSGRYREVSSVASLHDLQFLTARLAFVRRLCFKICHRFSFHRFIAAAKSQNFNFYSYTVFHRRSAPLSRGPPYPAAAGPKANEDVRCGSGRLRSRRGFVRRGNSSTKPQTIASSLSQEPCPTNPAAVIWQSCPSSCGNAPT